MHPAMLVSRGKATLSCGEELYERRFTHKHHQLRDLVHCSEDPNVIYGVCDSQSLRYDCQKDEDTVVQELSFTPTSMTYRHGYIAAGGEQSELEVKRISDDTGYKGDLNAQLNNSLHIATDCAGNTNLYIGNNDETIKVFRLPDMSPCTTFQCKTRINYTHLSSDGRYLVAVGDSHSIYVYQATPTGYELIQQYTEAQGDGMCCSWNASGSCYAAAYQDGTAVVFDFNSTNIVAKYKMDTHCFNVKFSCPGVDLMAIGESQSQGAGLPYGRAAKVHLVDSRRWDQLHTHAKAGADLVGMSFAPNGSKLYVGLSDITSAISIDTMSRRMFCTGSHL